MALHRHARVTRLAGSPEPRNFAKFLLRQEKILLSELKSSPRHEVCKLLPYRPE
jgi:hypothetical protein